MMESSVIVLCCLCFVIYIKLSSSIDSATAYVITDRSQSILLLYRVKDENGDSSTSQRLSTDAGHFAVAPKRVQRIRPNSRRTITYVFSNLFPPLLPPVYIVQILINMSAGMKDDCEDMLHLCWNYLLFLSCCAGSSPCCLRVKFSSQNSYTRIFPCALCYTSLGKSKT